RSPKNVMVVHRSIAIDLMPTQDVKVKNPTTRAQLTQVSKFEEKYSGKEMQGSRVNKNRERRDWDMRQMSIDDSRQRNWSDADVVHRQNDRRNSYRGNYGNGSQRKQRNQGFESRNRFDRDNQRFNNNNGKYQYRNRRPRENFSRENQRHGGRLNVLKVLDDQSQSIKNIPIRLLAICMSAAELLCVPILLNETFTKALWDTGAEKSFICENVYKSIFL
ncbi:hypothetical protein TNCV_3261451, partial [Trichonephila clavipes]